MTRKTAEATGYPERTVRRIVGEKASLCGAFTSPAKRYKVDRKTVFWMISMWKPYSVLSMISTTRRSTLRSTRCC